MDVLYIRSHVGLVTSGRKNTVHPIPLIASSLPPPSEFEAGLQPS